ncbi:MAG: glycosyltransferase [Gemmataceae bacterium]|nr:glycosyltransferase [Gemmataceae bacterium]
MNGQSQDRPTLLIVTYHFPPSAASGTFRTLGFARHLPAAGWATAVVAPPRIPWEPSDPKLLAVVPPDVRVYPAEYPTGLLWKPVQRLCGSYPSWLPRGLAACRRAVRETRPAAVLTSGPPHCVHLLGLALKRRYGLPWVADFRDPWLSNIGDTGRRFARWGERTVLRAADLILANAPAAARAFADAYPGSRDKIVTLTNGFDPPESTPGTAPTANGVLRVVHTGELYAGRDPRPYLDALADAGGGFRTRLIGRAAGAAAAGFDLAEEIAKRNLTPDIETLGQVSYGESLAAMHGADLLLLLDTPGRTAGVPAKLYEYFGAGRPILALAEPEGDVAAVLKRSGVLHRVAPPRDVPAIGRGLAELGAAVRAGEPAVPDPAALGRFTRAALARELAGHLDRIAGRPGSGGA